MEDKLYKCRVTVEVVMDVWTWGCHEDNAEARSEDIANDVVGQYIHDVLDKDEDISVSAWGVRCTDVEPYTEGE